MSAATIDRRFRLARLWSNAELRRFAALVEGDVVNVSAGDDVDKEGGVYADYFTGARSYQITNHAPEGVTGAFRGFQGRSGEIRLDLGAPLPDALCERFDAVFNHTTLEHVFEVREAVANLARMTRDLLILVVPFAQVQHEQAGAYEDFWRFSPTCMRRLLGENGLEVVYESANDDVNAAVYLFVVGSRRPERWKERVPRSSRVRPAGDWIGRPEDAGGRHGGALGRRVRRVWRKLARSTQERG